MAKFWTVDMFIEKERMHTIRSSSKRPLVKFVMDKMGELEFSLKMGSQLQNKNLGVHVISVIEASADPGVERYTRDVGVHNVISMPVLLKLMGDQTVQLTVMNKGIAITSWILKTTRDEVEYIQVIPGKADYSTVNVDLELDDFNFSESGNVDLVESIAILGKLLVSNKGIRRQPTMIRLMVAGGLEMVVGYLRDIDRKVVGKRSVHPANE
jgi:hypothetical protein